MVSRPSAARTMLICYSWHFWITRLDRNGQLGRLRKDRRGNWHARISGLQDLRRRTVQSRVKGERGHNSVDP